MLFGITDGKLAREIALNKADDMELLVCDLFPEHVRQHLASLSEISSHSSKFKILTDSSVWSILLLLFQNGYNSGNCHLVLNPSLTSRAKAEHQNLQRLFSGMKSLEIPDNDNFPSISAGAVLSPDEPGLEEFISNFPGWLNEIVLVWDCLEKSDFPRLTHPEGVTIINKCHPLEADFGAQRNRMLKECSGQWVVYLDADERLNNDDWNHLRRATSINDCKGWYLPRLTFYPDEQHVRTGYGLWPDLQLRLFQNTGKLEFINKIHEQIKGIEGPAGILPAAAINHLTHLLKSREKIEAKLEGFNEAAGGQYSHQLGAEFPNVERRMLETRNKHSLPAVILPEFNLL